MERKIILDDGDENMKENTAILTRFKGMNVHTVHLTFALDRSKQKNPDYPLPFPFPLMLST